MKNKLLFLFIILSVLAFGACSLTGKGNFEASPAGKWTRPDTNTVVVIAKKCGGYKLVSAIDREDKEIYTITKSEWKDGTFSFGWLVPSTGYFSNFVVQSCTESTLTVFWTGTAGEETEYFERINEK